MVVVVDKRNPLWIKAASPQHRYNQSMFAHTVWTFAFSCTQVVAESLDNTGLSAQLQLQPCPPKKCIIMKNLFDTKISFYENVADNVGTEISLRDFLFCDQYKEQIEHIRSIADEEQQKSLKKKLPQATISGTFAPTRKAENLMTHSNLLCIDIDRKDNPDVAWFAELRNEWQRIPQILYAAHSVRGEGWFAIFRIACPDKHRANKVLVEPKPTFHVPYYGSNPSSDLERAERCCREIVNCGIDITATYDDWFHVGAALASLGERGRSLYHLVSSQNTSYKAAETDRKFTNCLNNVSNISIGTFFHICSQYGISGKEDRP